MHHQADETAGRVVLHAEHGLVVMRRDVDLVVVRDEIEHDPLQARAAVVFDDAAVGVDPGGRVFVVVRAEPPEPFAEAVHEPQPFLEVRGALQEAPAVVQQAVLLGAGRRKLDDRGDFVQAGGGGEETRGAGPSPKRATAVSFVAMLSCANLTNALKSALYPLMSSAMV